MDPGELKLTIPAEMPLAEWKAAFGSYEAIAASARSRVIQEVYSRTPLDAPCFHAHEIPRTFGKEPKGAHFVSGKDAAGRVIVSRYVDPGPFGSTIQRFWLDRGDLEIGITFSWFTPKIPTSVYIRRLEGPRLIEQRTLSFQPGEALAGWSAEALARGSDRWERGWTVWAWEGDRVIARRDFASQLVSGGPPSYGSGRWEYDERGLARGTFTWDGRPEQLLWVRPEPGEKAAAVYAYAAASLVALLPRVVEAGAPVYAIALAYQDSNVNLPPQVFVARTDRRGQAVAPHQRDAAWMRAFLEEHVRIDDPDVVRRCERAVVRTHGNSVVLKGFLRDVARTLTRSDTWMATTTPDFVVLPLDFELDDL